MSTNISVKLLVTSAEQTKLLEAKTLAENVIPMLGNIYEGDLSSYKPVAVNFFLEILQGPVPAIDVGSSKLFTFLTSPDAYDLEVLKQKVELAGPLEISSSYSKKENEKRTKDLIHSFKVMVQFFSQEPYRSRFTPQQIVDFINAIRKKSNGASVSLEHYDVLPLIKVFHRPYYRSQWPSERIIERILDYLDKRKKERRYSISLTCYHRMLKSFSKLPFFSRPSAEQVEELNQLLIKKMGQQIGTVYNAISDFLNELRKPHYYSQWPADKIIDFLVILAEKNKKGGNEAIMKVYAELPILLRRLSQSSLKNVWTIEQFTDLILELVEKNGISAVSFFSRAIDYWNNDAERVPFDSEQLYKAVFYFAETSTSNDWKKLDQLPTLAPEKRKCDIFPHNNYAGVRWLRTLYNKELDNPDFNLLEKYKHSIDDEEFLSVPPEYYLDNWKSSQRFLVSIFKNKKFFEWDKPDSDFTKRVSLKREMRGSFIQRLKK